MVATTLVNRIKQIINKYSDSWDDFYYEPTRYIVPTFSVYATPWSRAEMLELLSELERATKTIAEIQYEFTSTIRVIRNNLIDISIILEYN